MRGGTQRICVYACWLAVCASPPLPPVDMVVPERIDRVEPATTSALVYTKDGSGHPGLTRVILVLTDLETRQQLPAVQSKGNQMVYQLNDLRPGAWYGLWFRSIMTYPLEYMHTEYKLMKTLPARADDRVASSRARPQGNDPALLSTRLQSNGTAVNLTFVGDDEALRILNIILLVILVCPEGNVTQQRMLNQSHPLDIVTLPLFDQHGPTVHEFDNGTHLWINVTGPMCNTVCWNQWAKAPLLNDLYGEPQQCADLRDLPKASVQPIMLQKVVGVIPDARVLILTTSGGLVSTSLERLRVQIAVHDLSQPQPSLIFEPSALAENYTVAFLQPETWYEVVFTNILSNPVQYANMQRFTVQTPALRPHLSTAITPNSPSTTNISATPTAANASLRENHTAASGSSFTPISNGSISTTNDSSTATTPSPSSTASLVNNNSVHATSGFTPPTVGGRATNVEASTTLASSISARSATRQPMELRFWPVDNEHVGVNVTSVVGGRVHFVVHEMCNHSQTVLQESWATVQEKEHVHMLTFAAANLSTIGGSCQAVCVYVSVEQSPYVRDDCGQSTVACVMQQKCITSVELSALVPLAGNVSARFTVLQRSSWLAITAAYMCFVMCWLDKY